MNLSIRMRNDNRTNSPYKQWNMTSLKRLGILVHLLLAVVICSCGAQQGTRHLTE